MMMPTSTVITMVSVGTSAASRRSIDRRDSSSKVSATFSSMPSSWPASSPTWTICSASRGKSFDCASAKQRSVALPKGLKLSITSAKEDRLNDHTGRIRFFPDGSSTGGRITLKAGRREWHVNVSWLTGQVQVVDTVASR